MSPFLRCGPTVFDADIILPRPELRFVAAQTDARVSVIIGSEKTPPAPAAKKRAEIAK